MNFLLCSLSSISLAVVSPIVMISEITTYSNKNMNEDDYFNNEIIEVINKYVDSALKDKATNIKHNVAIDTTSMGFLNPLSSNLNGKSEIYHSKAFLNNGLDTEQVLYTEEKETTTSQTNEFSSVTTISASTNVSFQFLSWTLSMNFSETQKHSESKEEKITFKSEAITVAPKTKVVVDYSIVKEIYAKEYNLMIPILNDEPFMSYSWSSGGWIPGAVTRTITPNEVYRAIHNDKTLMDYYFGPGEFYQYKDFIDHSWDTPLFWAVVKVKTYEEVNNHYVNILPDEN